MLIKDWKAMEYYQTYLVLKEEIMVMSLLNLDSTSDDLRKKVDELKFCIRQIELFGGVTAEQLLLLSMGVDASELYPKDKKELLSV